MTIHEIENAISETGFEFETYHNSTKSTKVLVKDNMRLVAKNNTREKWNVIKDGRIIKEGVRLADAICV